MHFQFSHSVVSDSLQPHESQHARPPCPSPTPGVHSNSCPSSWWCHPVISSSVIPFSSRLQSFLASGSVQMSQLFASGGQSIGVSASASVLPMNIQDWFPLGWTGWISSIFTKFAELHNHHQDTSVWPFPLLPTPPPPKYPCALGLQSFFIPTLQLLISLLPIELCLSMASHSSTLA